MLLFGIGDIRLFWSRDQRFLGQFSDAEGAGNGVGKEEGDGVSPAGGKIESEGRRKMDRGIKRFIPFSKYPASPRDVAFWLPSPSPSSSSTTSPSSPSSSSPIGVHENDIMETIRTIGGDLVEDVKLVDEFQHEQSGRRSFCYRIVYRSLERTLRGEEVNDLHRCVGEGLARGLGVELR